MFSNRRVLLADDQSTVRDELKELLRQCRCGVMATANSTDDLMEKFHQLRPDVIIADVTLAGTQSLLVTLSRLRRLDSSLILLVTGAVSQNEILMEALSMGAQDFLTRPFRQRTVNAFLQRNLA
jgi:two-component system chemotaxis response regulator CheY